MNITSTINVDGSTDTGNGIQSQKSLGLASWEEILKESMSGSATVSSHAPSSSSQTIPSGVVFEQENMVLSELFGGESVSKQQLSIPVSAQPHWQVLYFFFFWGSKAGTLCLLCTFLCNMLAFRHAMRLCFYKLICRICSLNAMHL